jgi:hypothetical protein
VFIQILNQNKIELFTFVILFIELTSGLFKGSGSRRRIGLSHKLQLTDRLSVDLNCSMNEKIILTPKSGSSSQKVFTYLL